MTLKEEYELIKKDKKIVKKICEICDKASEAYRNNNSDEYVELLKKSLVEIKKLGGKKMEEVEAKIIYLDKKGNVYVEVENFECETQSIGSSDFWGSEGSDGEEIIDDEILQWFDDEQERLEKDGYLCVSYYENADEIDRVSTSEIDDYMPVDVNLDNVLEKIGRC